MNGKKAKMLRKVGRVEKRTKKLYNTLSHEEKSILSKVYKTAIENNYKK